MNSSLSQGTRWHTLLNMDNLLAQGYHESKCLRLNMPLEVVPWLLHLDTISGLLLDMEKNTRLLTDFGKHGKHCRYRKLFSTQGAVDVDRYFAPYGFGHSDFMLFAWNGIQTGDCGNHMYDWCLNLLKSGDADRDFAYALDMGTGKLGDIVEAVLGLHFICVDRQLGPRRKTHEENMLLQYAVQFSEAHVADYYHLLNMMLQAMYIIDRHCHPHNREEFLAMTV